MSDQMWHRSIGGDVEAAVLYGLTLKAKCGLVWVPTIHGNSEDHPEIPNCKTCFRVEPHAVYRCYDKGGRLIYVGCTRDPATRNGAHRANSWWWSQVVRTRLLAFPDKNYALTKESQAIREEKPLWNVRGQVYSDIPLEELEWRYRHALAIEAPRAWLARLERECLKHHGRKLKTLAEESA